MGEIVEKARGAIGRVEALGERARGIFTQFDAERILADAGRVESLIAGSSASLPLAGKLVSVKDLFDEAGERTTAGSRLLQDREPATEDCQVVARMKAAGAVMFGRTSMSEFAYSGVGLNPHHGTPGNAIDETRIPGGSTSGGGVSVALGLCDIALGTDTGGSVRIPAAINGLFGIKPSQYTVPLTNVHPLSQTLDSAGPLACSLEETIAAYAVMSATPAPASKLQGPLKLGLPKGAFVNDLDEAVGRSFEAALARLRAAGHRIEEIDLGFLPAQMDFNRIIVSSEALATYHADLDRLEEIGDPHVLKRIRFAQTLSKAQVEEAYAARAATVAQFSQAMEGFDALLAPTLQITPPTIAETEADFDRLNGAMLRNPSMINFVDGCAISMPLQIGNGGVPGALMLSGMRGSDWHVLQVAEALLPGLK